MFDVVAHTVDDAGHDDLVIGQFPGFEDPPFMGVARIGGFHQQALGFGLHHHVENVLKRDIEMMGAFVIAPADMHPHAI